MGVTPAMRFVRTMRVGKGRRLHCGFLSELSWGAERGGDFWVSGRTSWVVRQGVEPRQCKRAFDEPQKTRPIV